MNTTTAAIPQEDRPEEPKKALRLSKKPADAGDTIQNLAINRWFVLEDSSLLDLADDLNAYPTIPAVGVTDQNGKLLGQIIRQDLLDLLGRPFGRDVLQKENVVRVAQNSKTFRQTESILEVCAQIGHDNLAAQQGYFPVKSAQGEYAGIFSTQDLLVYLSAASPASNAVSGSIQHRLVKELQILETAGYDVLSTTFRSQNANGDFSYIRQYDKEAWTIGFCASQAENVVGNQVAALLWGVVNTFDFRKGIMQFVRQLNALILKSFANLPGIHGLFVDFQSATGGLTLCDHDNGTGYIYRKAQFLKMKSAEAAPAIGEKAELSTDIFRYQLKPGDLVFLLNKSLANQPNQQGDEYGPNRLKALLDANPDISIRKLRGLIQNDFRAFRGPSNQNRDASLVIIHFKQAKPA